MSSQWNQQISDLSGLTELFPSLIGPSGHKLPAHVLVCPLALESFVSFFNEHTLRRVQVRLSECSSVSRNLSDLVLLLLLPLLSSSAPPPELD